MKPIEAYKIVISKAKELKLSGIKTEINFIKDGPYPFRNFKDDFLLPYKKWIIIKFTIKYHYELTEVYQAENEFRNLGVSFNLTGDAQILTWNIDNSFIIKKKGRKRIKYRSL